MDDKVTMKGKKTEKKMIKEVDEEEEKEREGKRGRGRR